MQNDRRYMALALSLGRRGMGRCWPNPAVGCVIVKDGRIIGRGWTQPGGRPHAEVVALAQAGAEALGATAYVTLEPCAHYGQTPPCASALIGAGIARVVAALEDPDPRVSGGGHSMLQAAGITVETGLMADQAARDHAGFLLSRTEGRAMVTLKLASSFDGRIATASGDSQWITGSQARRLVHAQRAVHDAVMVGGGTARADNPSLTVRDLGMAHQPVRVVCARKLDLPLDGKLAQTAREVPVWLCHGPEVPDALRHKWEDLGAKLVEVPVGSGGHLEPSSLVKQLCAQGLTRIFCEGGSALASSLLGADLVDDLVGFTAGVVLGAEGYPAVGAMGIGALSEAPRFTLFETRQIGADVMHHWTRR